MEGGYGRGIPGVVPVGIPVYRVEVSVEKNRIEAHFGTFEWNLRVTIPKVSFPVGDCIYYLYV